jgi:hypothetical protein
MPKRRKYRDTPESVLHRVIADLEHSDEPGHPSHHRAIRALLTEGPLVVPAAIHQDPDFPDPRMASAWRAELVAFLRSIVRAVEGRRALEHLRDEAGLPPDELVRAGHLPIRSGASYGVLVTRQGELRRVVERADDAQDVVHEQLLRLLELVGVRGNVRSCEASDCPHIFVRTYRQRFCSQTCQDRTNKRKHRREAAEKERQQQERARRRRVSRGR